MRVAHVITRMIVGGAQENTLLTCLGLQRDFGDEVLLITGPSLGPEGGLLSRGRAGELPILELPRLQRKIDPLRDALAYRDIHRALRDFQPDVVHTHSAKGGILGRYAAHALGVRAIVHTVHGAPFHPYQPRPARWFYQYCERRAAKRCHQLVSVADAMTDLLVAAKVAPREKFVTVYSGMDVEPFRRANQDREQTRAALGIMPEEVVIGKIARLFHLKGHDDLIEVARKLREGFPAIRWLLVGDGILRKALESKIKEAGLQQQFIFTGLVDPMQIPGLIGAMDILVHTSYREGLARTLPQALIAGKPVISYDIDGAREVVLDDQTGFLIRPGDIPQLSERLGRLIASESLRHRLGVSGQQRFTDRFRDTTMTGQLREIYQRLLGSR